MSQSKYKNMTTGQIIADLDIVKKTIEYHYKIENEALKTDDLYNGKMLDFVANELAENDNDVMEYGQYEKIAKNIMDKIADDLANEILERDRDTIEYENERHEAMKGDY